MFLNENKGRKIKAILHFGNTFMYIVLNQKWNGFLFCYLTTLNWMFFPRKLIESYCYYYSKRYMLIYLSQISQSRFRFLHNEFRLLKFYGTLETTYRNERTNKKPVLTHWVLSYNWCVKYINMRFELWWVLSCMCFNHSKSKKYKLDSWYCFH